MNSKQFMLLLIVCGIMSLVGSALVSVLCQSGNAAYADAVQVLKVSSIELVNAQGVVTGRLNATGEYGPHIELYGADEARAVLGIDELGNPECALANRKGIRQIAIGMDDCGGELIVSDNDDGHMIELYVDEKDFGCLEILNRRGESNGLFGTAQ